MTEVVDFFAQDVDVQMANDRRYVVLTIVLGDATCTVSLPRERLEKLGDKITQTLAEV